MRKYSKIIGLLFALALVASCSKDDYVEPTSKTKSFGIYASFLSQGSGGPNINPTYVLDNELVGISDISQGELSHEWSFWSADPIVNYGDSQTWSILEDGVSFIKNNSALGYNDITDFSPYIDSSIGTVNSQEVLVFFFEKGGNYKLRIRNTYNKQVRYVYSITDPIDGYSSVNEYIDATPIGNGEYEIIREYEFEVYDRFDVAYNIYYDRECTKKVDLDPTTTIDDEPITEILLKQGSTLTFQDITGYDDDGNSTTYSLPSGRIWSWEYYPIEGDEILDPAPVVDPDVAYSQYQDFTFNEIGTFKVQVQVYRSTPDYYVSSHYPTITTTEQIPLLVTVVDPADLPSIE